MGLFDFFKKKKVEPPQPQQNWKTQPVKSTVSKEEKQYYQEDSYYTPVSHADTPFERKVTTFEERKKTAIPSSRGLYPAEILLLEYCSKGRYPAPTNGYPGFWWFEYGIRDVGAALKTLEDRGFIVFASAKDSIGSFTIPQLKELLSSKGVTAIGKKADIVQKVCEIFSEDELLSTGLKVKYVLTEIGKQELEENAYVPYMHSAHNKTIEDDRLSITFNVWSINKLLGLGDKSNWKAVVEEQESIMNKDTVERNKAFMEELKEYDPKGYEELKSQDDQLEAVQRAREKFSQDKDIDSYIVFWEALWNNGGLKFEGSGWHFELADLYIKSKRYEDALTFVKKIKSTKTAYSSKADYYIAKIEGLIKTNK